MLPGVACLTTAVAWSCRVPQKKIYVHPRTQKKVIGSEGNLNARGLLRGVYIWTGAWAHQQEQDAIRLTVQLLVKHVAIKVLGMSVTAAAAMLPLKVC
jgi:hypothetical protein